MRMGLVILLSLLLGTMVAWAQPEKQSQEENEATKKRYLYQWIDDRGAIHITDSLDKVPKKFREKANMMEQSGKEDTAAGHGEQTSAPAAPVRVDAEVEAGQMAVWQMRMKDARERLANLERQYQTLEQKRISLLTMNAAPADKAEAQRIEEEMKGVQLDINIARNDIAVTIPDEARKAGVPPGWLRE